MTVRLPIGVKVHWSGCDKDRSTGKHISCMSERDVHIIHMQLHDIQPRYHIVFRDDKGEKAYRMVASDVLSGIDTETDVGTWQSESLCL